MPYEVGYKGSSYDRGPCEEPGCVHRGVFRGLCQKHHVALGPQGRLLRYVDKSDSGCWVWNGPTVQGYGLRTLTNEHGVRRSAYVHRLAYEWWVGPIPNGYQVDHLCRVTRCVNPEHLEAVSPQENTLRSTAPSAIAVATNKCKRGHEFTPTNTRYSAKGSKYCRACLRMRAYELRTGNPHPARDDAEARLRWTSTSSRIAATREMS